MSKAPRVEEGGEGERRSRMMMRGVDGQEESLLPLPTTTPPPPLTLSLDSQPYNAVLALYRGRDEGERGRFMRWAKEWKEDGLTAAHSLSCSCPAATLCVPQNTQAGAAIHKCCCCLGPTRLMLIYLYDHLQHTGLFELVLAAGRTSHHHPHHP